VRQVPDLPPKSLMAGRGPAPLALLLILAAPAFGAIFPDQIGDYTRSAPKTFSSPDEALYAEYGIEATEQADYSAPQNRKFTATAWRSRDTTGAMALFQARRPAGAVYQKLADLSVTTSDGQIFARGNYVFQLTGKLPPQADLDPIYAQLPKLEQSPLPALIGYLPSAGLVPNSERYIMGPVSLDRFGPGIPAATAAFHLGAEGQIGKYRTPKGVLTLVIFNYPTPNLARDRFEDFQKVPGIIAKRTGPLVAAISGNPDADSAERLLSQVRYEANLTWNEKVPQNEVKQFSNMILAMFALAGMLILGSIVCGIGFGGFRVLRRKWSGKPEQEEMITLHLGGN
jgi:hypothetical protein